jgi:membrane-associated phospholipid phosphatase
MDFTIPVKQQVQGDERVDGGGTGVRTGRPESQGKTVLGYNRAMAPSHTKPPAAGPGREQTPAPGRLSAHLGAHLSAHLGAKVAVLLGLTVGICVPYFALQQIEVFPHRTPYLTALDRLIPFDPAWIWPYLSITLLVPLMPMLSTSREQLGRYARGLALLCLACFAAFLLFPVLGPRPDVFPEHGLYALIVSYDRPSNSLPSLHAGLTTYSLLYGYRVLRGELAGRGRIAYMAFAAIWGGAILYSTMATKQHWAMDLPAAVLLAYGAHALAWRGAPNAQGRESVALSAG